MRRSTLGRIMRGRFSALADILRPRALARTAKSVDDLVVGTRELKRTLKQLEGAGEALNDRTSALEREIRKLRTDLAELAVGEARLRAIYQNDVEMERSLAAVGPVLDARRIHAHLERAVASSTLQLDPFPHMVIRDLFPQEFYDAIVKGIPPTELFDGADNKQRIVVPFTVAPAFSRRVWGFLLDTAIDEGLGPLLIRAFRAPLTDWLETTWPSLHGRSIESAVTLHNTDGRILLRRRGYVIPPHRDPKWGFITCLLYLAKPGDSAEWGTQLYEVESDSEASSVAPHWIRPEQCRLVKNVPFEPNTALVFLNSRGAHGAQIPADAEPPDLERYIYQFRIGPTAESIRRLVATLPAERRELWSGKVADYA
jgi:hypothetical protein